MSLHVETFVHEPTGTFTHVAADIAKRAAAIIDPVLDYDHAAGRTGTESAQRLVDYVRENDLQVEWIMETHAHADHLSAAPWLKKTVGGRIAIGEGIRDVQKTFQGIFNLKDLAVDGRQFDHLFSDGETFQVGSCDGRVINTPGHTSDSVS